MEVRATDEVRRSEFGTVEKLRILSPDKAFYFYRGVGDPLHKIANSLPEFADIAKNIDVDSIEFHVERGDFERWFRLLGEQSLANEVEWTTGQEHLASRTEERAELDGRIASQPTTTQGSVRQTRTPGRADSQAPSAPGLV